MRPNPAHEGDADRRNAPRRVRRWSSFFLSMFWLVAPVLTHDAHALQVPQRSDAPAPGAEPGATLVVSVITMGQGDIIWEKFGHNALRIRDTARAIDLWYNWGLFDPDEKGFALRFLKGQMRYAMGSDATRPMIQWYARHDRHIWEQVLNLTNAQKAEILRLARANDNDASRYYDYDYYLDNCSTRVRDIIDAVLGGQIRAATDTFPTGNTYRGHTRRLLNGSNLHYFGIQLVLGHPADRTISRWEEMFLPVRMMRYLNEVQIRGADGQLVPLVLEQIEINRPVKRPPEEEAIRPKTAGYLLVGAVLAALMVALGTALARGATAARPWYILVSLAWCVGAGLAGTFALAMWLFTEHNFMDQNETVLVLNPLLLAGAFVLRGAVLRGKRAGAMRSVAAAVAVATIVAAIIHFLPGMGQDNVEMVVLALAPNLALWATTGILVRPPVPEKTK